MTTITTTLEIERPPAEVFDVVTDTVSWLAISPMLLEIQPRGRIAAGTRGTMVRKQGRRRVQGSWEVVELTPLSRLVMDGGEPGVATHEVMELQELPGGRTRFTSTMTFRPRGLRMRLFLPLLAPVIRRSVRSDYGRLKAHIEAQAPGS
ncbi:MAG: SRPBCC family protein [Thermoleophilia bacterium]|nr:SRPBCC family protein [Thermoleophilia bacterium]